MLLLTPYVTNADGTRIPFLPDGTPFRQWSSGTDVYKGGKPRRTRRACVWVGASVPDMQPWLGRNSSVVRVASMSAQEISDAKTLHTRLMVNGRLDRGVCKELRALRQEKVKPWLNEWDAEDRAATIGTIISALLPFLVRLGICGAMQFLATRYGFQASETAPFLLGTVVTYGPVSGTPSHYDDFTGYTNGTDCEGDSVATGAGTVKHVLGYTGTVRLQHYSSTYVSTSHNFTGIVVIDGSGLGDDQWIAADFADTSSAGFRQRIGVRFSDYATMDSFDGYTLGRENANLAIRRWDNGTASTVAGGGSAPTLVTPMTLELAIDGDTFAAYLNGVDESVLSGASDSTYASGTVAYGTANSRIIYGWEGGTLAGPAAEYPRKRYAFFPHLRR